MIGAYSTPTNASPAAGPGGSGTVDKLKHFTLVRQRP